ncbi:hypothetical protein [Pimelobacter simplex]|uniref:hypothetical protein n=1 Tax=Nocardioides simplex TaxID=2045 RepID=UPI003AABDF46
MPDDDRQSPPSSYCPHLIEYQDVGPAGVACWIDLRNEFARALDPVITSLDLEATPNTLLEHTGAGLEALGYLLMLRDGAGPKPASRATLRERLERVLPQIDDVVPFDGAIWVTKPSRPTTG